MVVIFSGFSIMGASLENLSIGYVMPYAKCDLNLTTSEQGVLAAVSYLGIVSTSYVYYTISLDIVACTIPFDAISSECTAFFEQISMGFSYRHLGSPESFVGGRIVWLMFFICIGVFDEFPFTDRISFSRWCNVS